MANEARKGDDTDPPSTPAKPAKGRTRTQAVLCLFGLHNECSHVSPGPCPGCGAPTADRLPCLRCTAF